MNRVLEDVCDALISLSESVIARAPNKNLFVESQGWNTPSISYRDLADFPKNLAEQIRNSNIEELSEDLEESLKDVPRKLTLLTQHTLAQIHGGQGAQGIPAYMATIQWIAALVQPNLYWESVQDPKAMPPMLAKRLSSLKKQLDELSIDKEELLSQIQVIQGAYSAAESLPADLITLKEAREKISTLSDQSIKDADKIEKLKEKSVSNEESINAKIEQANKLIDQCEEAYRVTTTKGLAGAFEDRANRLSRSMWVWVFGLLVALVIGALIGSERLQSLTLEMRAENANAGIIALQAILSVLSLGAPLWFAWISTKQIGQRFKLSEDYAFKASVAKAYEGYRKEAAKIDPVFEARLFSTALTRVEEAPLRLIDQENHSSPWQELLSSPGFQKALDTIPEFRDKFIEVAKEGLNTVKKISESKIKSEKPD
jgi:hypothetical protein